MSDNELLVLPDELYKKLEQKGGYKANKLGRQYNAEEKIQVATYWMIGYSSRDIEKMLQVPASTCRYWMQQPWWKDLMREVRKAKNEELDNQLTRIIHKSARQLEDRIDHGNYSRNPITGEMERIPLKSSELAKDGMGIPFDKRAMVRGDPTSKVAREEVSQEKVLEQLAEAFLKVVKQSEPKPIEGEVIEEDDPNDNNS